MMMMMMMYYIARGSIGRCSSAHNEYSSLQLSRTLRRNENKIKMHKTSCILHNLSFSGNIYITEVEWNFTTVPIIKAGTTGKLQHC